MVLRAMTERRKIPKRNITSADIEAARNLRRLWREKKTKLRLTQESVATEEFGATQGLISQYLTGKIALGPVAVLKFAKVLQVEPREIRKDFDLLMGTSDKDLTAEARQLAHKWMALPSRMRDNVKKHIEDLLDAISQKHQPSKDRNTDHPHKH